jgi:HlyD family secretion protein
MKFITNAVAVLGLVGAGLLVPTVWTGVQPVLGAEQGTNPDWVVAAPGRLEPKGGMVNIGTAIIGRIADVYVSLNDEVAKDELLLKLDDAEARARLAAAETQADVREKARDDGRLSDKRKDVRDAEDEVYRAERAATGARIELDYALSGRRNGTVTERTLRNARRRLEEADDRVGRARVKVAKAQADPDLPAPTPAEAAVSEARAQVAIAEALLDKTRVRAPRSGRVLILRAKTGEMVAPSPQQPLVVIGDMSGLQVTAEVDEADVAKIEVGQRAYVTSISYPDRKFDGKVAKVAPALARPEIMQRGARRPTDVEVLEVTIDLEGDVPLLPGMRVDAFFRR